MRRCLLLAQVLLLLIAPARALSQDSLDVFWDDRFDVLGLDRAVHALCSDGQDLYVGGEFRYAGDVLVKKIARWDGTQWHTLGDGVFSDANHVHDIIVYGGDVYACGTFENIGGVAASYLARWNGANWSAVGGGVPATGYALAEFNGQLYAGGAGWLMRWDGSSWTDAGDPEATTGSPSVRDLAVSGSYLYACGRFTSLGGTPLLRVARGDGSSWWPLGSGLEGECSATVFALCASGSDVYAVGQYYREPGGTILEHIGRWDGAAWHAMGGIYRNPIESCDVPFALSACGFGGGTVVGGYWEEINGQAIPYLAWYTGGDWVSFGSGVNYTVIALCEHNGALVVGGGFTQAGGKTSNRIGIWWPNGPPTEVGTPDVGLSLSQNAPNPFNPATRIEFSTDHAASVALTIFDAKGRVVRTLFNGHLPAGNHVAEWDGRDDNGIDLSSGVYFYQLRTGTKSLTRKAVVLK